MANAATFLLYLENTTISNNLANDIIPTGIKNYKNIIKLARIKRKESYTKAGQRVDWFDVNNSYLSAFEL